MTAFLKIVLAILLTPLVPLLAYVCRRRVRQFVNDVPHVFTLFSQVPWQEVWQRPQEYACHVARHTPVVYVAAVQPHQLLLMWRIWRPLINPTSNQLLVVSPLVFSGYYKIRWICDINAKLLAWMMSPLFLSDRIVTIVSNSPFFAPVLIELDHSGLMATQNRFVYDLIDDFPAFKWAPDWARAMDDVLKERADALTCGTLQLKRSNPEAEYVGCGVDYSIFQRNCDGATGSEPPVIGFFGTISERIDLALIGQLAEKFTQCTIRLIGPVHLPASALPTHTNLEWLGLVPHSELPDHARRFNVAIIPFVDSEATRALNPVKTLEYMAAGIPVVATRLPDLEELFSEHVFLASSHEEFLAHVAAILEGRFSRDMVESGLERARNTSWEAMGLALDKVIFANNRGETVQGGTP